VISVFYFRKEPIMSASIYQLVRGMSKKKKAPPGRFEERSRSMKFLSHHKSLFKKSVLPAQEDIEQHLRRLNELLLLYQQLKTMTATEWIATEREIEMELQWFDIHHLKLTSTSYPIPRTAVCAPSRHKFFFKPQTLRDIL